jgi:hypothetical protein
VQVNPIANTTYTVIGNSPESCQNTQTFALVVSPCTNIGVNTAENLDLLIYPNPSNGSFTVKSETDIQLQLINELGQLISTLSLDETNNHEYSVREIVPGIYFLLGSKENSAIQKKIVITN